MTATDVPGLDLAALDRRIALLLTGSEHGPVQRSQLSGGLSQMTLRYDANDVDSVVVRVPPTFGPLEPYEPAVEAGLIEAMGRRGIPAPPVLLVEPDAEPTGRPFFVTGFTAGTMMAEATGSDPETALRTATAFIELLAQVHAVPLDGSAASVSLRELLGHLPFKTPDGLIDRWDGALDSAGIAVPGYHRFLGEWLRDHRPAPSQDLVVVHGDFRLANLLWDSEKSGAVTALLDWEEAALGDPIYDLAWLLMGSFEDDDVVYGLATRAQLIDSYQEFSGRTVDAADLLWWEVAVGWALLAMNGLAVGLAGQGRYADIRPMLYGYMNRRIAQPLLRKVAAHEELRSGRRA